MGSSQVTADKAKNKVQNSYTIEHLIKALKIRQAAMEVRAYAHRCVLVLLIDVCCVYYSHAGNGAWNTMDR